MHGTHHILVGGFSNRILAPLIFVTALSWAQNQHCHSVVRQIGESIRPTA